MIIKALGKGKRRTLVISEHPIRFDLADGSNALIERSARAALRSWLENLTHKEAAEALGISESSVRRLLKEFENE